MPSSAAVSPIASWPPQPWTWTSTKPGVTSGPPAAAGSCSTADDPAVRDLDPARFDPVLEDEPAADDHDSPVTRV